MLQLGEQQLLPTPPSSCVSRAPLLHSTLLPVTSIATFNPVGVLGRATDNAGGLEAYSVASRVLEAGTNLLFAKLDDGELVIKMSSLSSRVARVDSTDTICQPHSVATATISGGAHTPDSTTSDDRMQVPLSTRCTRPTALRTPAATAPSLCDGSKLTSRPAACALAAAHR